MRRLSSCGTEIALWDKLLSKATGERMISTRVQTGLSRRKFLYNATIAMAVGACAYTGGVRARSPVIDGLSFLPQDLSQLATAGLDAIICDVSEVRAFTDANGSPRYRRDYETNMAALNKAIERLETSPYAFAAGAGRDIGSRPQCAVFLQFQSCEPLDADLSRLARFHERGLRVLQFTHHNQNLFAGGALDRHASGLTELGRSGLDEMNRLRILPDVSHGSDATMLEAAQRSRTPIVLSHGACRALLDHPRCAPDEVIRAIADCGGAMGIFMMSFWLTRDPVPRVEHLIAHIRHVIRVGGIEAVGIANDFPVAGQPNLTELGNDNARGVQEYIPWWLALRKEGVPGFGYTPAHVVIPELNNIDRTRTIARELERARFKPDEIDRIMGRNWQRVLRDVLV